MPLARILRLLLAGLVACLALLTPGLRASNSYSLLSFGAASTAQADDPEGQPAATLDPRRPTQASEGTWEIQLAGATLRGVYFVDANNGWAVGDAGVILHTSNGGRTWSGQTSGTGEILYDVDFVNPYIGRAVKGGSGATQYTWDGGATWVAHGTGVDLRALDLVDTGTGWLVGVGGSILKVSNGGATWTFQTSGVTNSLYSVSFVDTNTGWAAGDGGTILKTSNGGATWSKQASGTNANLRSVRFVDSSNGWAVGDGGVILRTTDGGFIWQEQVSGTSQNLTAVTFVDTLKGLAVGEGGTILHTVNGGATWSRQTSPTSVALHDVALVDAQSGWVVGDGGTILHTADGGATWEVQVSSTSGSLRGIDFVDSSSGWVVGDGGVILHTSDGGGAWVFQSSSVTTTLYSVSLVDSKTGWAVGDAGTILKTANGGATWIPQSPGITTTLRSVAFVDANNGWAVGDQGTILRTTDSGRTWTAQSSGTTQPLTAVAFLDAQDGWAVGGSTPPTPQLWFTPPAIQGVILRTSDGGDNWMGETAPPVYGLALPVHNSIWTVGLRVGKYYSKGEWYGLYDTVWHSASGVAWSVRWTGDVNKRLLRAIAAADPTNAWAVGESGTVVRISLCDGDGTAGGQNVYTNLHLLGVTFVDALNGWAVGQSGTILRYRGITSLLPKTYEAQFVRQSFSSVMFPGSTAPAWIELRNTGTATWYREGPNPVALGTSNPQDRSSPFYTPGAWASANRPARLDQEPVAPGELGRFTFTLTAPASEGNYREYFRPVAEGLTWFNDLGIYFDITVASTPPAVPYGAVVVDQSYPSIMVPGQRARAWVELRNAGSETWQRGGPNPLMLGTSRPSDRPSAFYTPGGWVSPSRPARLDQESVALGGVGRFTFDLTAPASLGSYQEYFRPIAEGLTWLNDLGLYFGITVTSTLQTSMSISPSCGSTLTSNDPSRSTTIQAPSHTVTDTAVLTYTYRLPQPTGDLLGIDHFFELTATQQGIVLQQLSAPLMITVKYTDAEVAGVLENGLKLYRMSGGQWVTQGITSTVDVARNIITSTSAYLGRFGVLGGPPTRVYIPALTKGYSGW